VADGLELPTIELEAVTGDEGSTFRLADDQWLYNLRTSGLATGTYVLRLELPDGRQWEAAFVLR
jgi:protein gp37